LADFILEKSPDRRIVEIGPGLGALTKPLLSRGALVTAIELDRGLAAQLNTWPEAADGRLKILEADVLTVDLKKALGTDPVLICGNIPYNISSPVLFWFMNHSDSQGVFTIQKEMAQRLSAQPGSRSYGRLSVAVSLWYSIEVPFNIPPSAFQPRPKVDSSVIWLSPKISGPAVTRPALGRLTAAAFHARRKTIFNNLLAAYGRKRTEDALEVLKIEPSARAETLEPDLLACLAHLLEENGLAGE
jgi:16S rRNA (adenine1518-N6/adenine1519-N6)-dimethyltransferase